MYALVLFLALASGEPRRPLYNIAHMVNSIADLDNAMKDGANAVESDVAFSDNGTATRLYHGAPCDCFRECHAEERVDRFFDYLRRSTNEYWGPYKNQFTLLFLDLKIEGVDEDRKYAAGVDLAQKLILNLWHGVLPFRTINVLLSIPSVSGKNVLRGAIDTISSYNSRLLDKLGFNVADNDDVDSIRDMYQRLGIHQHFWQGDGITNCLSYLCSAERLKRVIKNRDSYGRQHYVEKVYHWTVDIPEVMRRSIRAGVDAIITNRPRRMSRIMEEDEFSGLVRLADLTDSPWERFFGPTLSPGQLTKDAKHLAAEGFDSVLDDAVHFLEE